MQRCPRALFLQTVQIHSHAEARAPLQERRPRPLPGNTPARPWSAALQFINFPLYSACCMIVHAKMISTRRCEAGRSVCAFEASIMVCLKLLMSCTLNARAGLHMLTVQP